MPIGNEILTLRNTRAWIQYGGARPNNRPVLAGVGTQYLMISGLSMPVRGGIDPVRVHDPAKLGRFKLVAFSQSAPDLDGFTMTQRQKRGAVSRVLQRRECPINVYILGGDCKSLNNFQNGWTEPMLILAYALMTTIDGGDRTGWDNDDPIENTIDMVAVGGSYEIGPLSFTEGGSVQIEYEVLDGVYGGGEMCGDCGPDNDGTKYRYVLTTFGANPASVVYTVDGGLNWVALPITGIGASEVPTVIRQIGDNLVVFSKLGGGATLSAHYISPINTLTGVPSSTWVKVTTGYVATFTLNDVRVIDSQNVFIVASGGYIYKATDITAGVSVLNAAAATTQNLTRIQGYDSTLLAVGAAGIVLKSLTGGQTWASTTASPEAATLGAPFVLDSLRFWAASPTRLYYTLNGGETWTESTFSGSGSGTITDLQFSTDEVGYLSHTLSGAGRLFTCMAGAGDGWTNLPPRILNLPPSIQRINRINVPDVTNQAIRSNNVLAVGLGTTTDGIAVIGTTNRI